MLWDVLFWVCAVYGYISATGFLQSVLGCATLLLTNLAVRRLDEDSSLF